ncbi:MAG: hypothetical protein PVG95_09330 [Methyloceanibacter sp.]|jgi:hypothetical protein
MLFYAHNSQGLGAVLIEGTNYKCGAKLCYGVDGATNTHRLFQDLQQAANQVAALFGLAPIAVDGLIGVNTVTLIREIAARVPAATGALGQARGAFSKEVAAKTATELTTQLKALLVPRPVATPSTSQPSPTVLTPTTTAPAQSGASPMTTPAAQATTSAPSTQATTPTQSAAAAMTSMTPTPKKTPVLAIAGVIGGVALLGTIIAVIAVRRSGH